jgi:hypothetical protein
MKRPIGVTLLAIGSGLIGVWNLYKMLIYMGVTSWNFGIGKDVSFKEPQWGAAFWALLIAAIWFWEAQGFWRVRAYAYSFGVFIAMFTLIWGFFALLFGSTYEAETIPWLLAGVILLYLQYPGVQQHFIQTEMDRLTPEQRAAYQQLQAANMAVAQARGGVAPAPAPSPAPVAPAQQPPTEPGGPTA